MDVKPGYKQTDVGIIPEAWDVKLLPEVLRFSSGKAHEQFISETGRYICVNSKFISTNGKVRKFSSKNFSPAKKGDILMVMSDLPNGRALAKAFLVDKDDLYAVNQRVCALTAYRDCPEFFFYVLNRHPYFLKFDDGVSQTHLLNGVFKKCSIQIPSLVIEQRAIATALSDVDAMLDSLDRLIAKKRDLKQAALQQLLTGKTRLQGFSGEWEVRCLGEMADPTVRWAFTGGPFGSNLKSSDYTDEGVRIIQLQNIGDGIFLDDSKIYTSVKKADELISCNIYPGEIILSKMGDPVARACIIPATQSRYLMCSDGIRLALDQSQFCTYFIFSMINASVFREKASNASTGSTRKRIGITELRSLEMVCPTIAEQTAIAAILSQMDTEIDLLENRRNKTAALKQGMMQELLTGRTRLV